MAKAALKVATTTDETMIPYDQATSASARITITIEGITPLLTHNPESMGTGTEAKRGSRVPEAEAEAEAGCYRNEDGVCCIKGDAPRGALLAAGGAWKGKNRTTMKSVLAHVVVVEQLLPLYRKSGEPIRDYVIDARRAIVQRQGIIRRRPRFDEWRTSFTVEFDPVLIRDPKMIVDIAADAGNRIGVCDFRPQKNGPFGRFRILGYRLQE